MSRKYLSKLRQMLAEYFSEGDLRTLCFDLGMDYDDLPGQGKANKARELVAYLDRRGRIPELVGMCQELRPNVAWGESRDRDGKVPSPSTARSAGMDYELGLQTLGTCLSGDALDEFRVFESRLRENLQRERLYGSTETTRADRAAIVDALNRLAQVHLGTSFNDLCQGTASPATSAATPHRASAGSERELASLRRQLAEACENLELIRERKSQFVMETTIPLDLIKQERRLEEKINHLEAEIARLGGSTSTGRASGSSPGGVQINSGGGAVILGDVNVEGGDFVGRDKVDRSKGDLD
jgi:hypothetical protein